MTSAIIKQQTIQSIAIIAGFKITGRLHHKPNVRSFRQQGCDVAETITDTH